MQVPTTKGMDKHLWVICSVLLNASIRFGMDLQQIANTSVLLLDPRIEGLKPEIIVCVSDVSKLEKVTTTGEVALLLSVQYAWARIMLWYVWYRRANKKSFPLNRTTKMMMNMIFYVFDFYFCYKIIKWFLSNFCQIKTTNWWFSCIFSHFGRPGPYSPYVRLFHDSWLWLLFLIVVLLFLKSSSRPSQIFGRY